MELRLNAVDGVQVGENFSVGRKVVGSVKVYCCAADLIRLQHTERRCIDVNRDEILTTDVRVTELMDIRHAGASYFARRTFAPALVAKSTLVVVSKHGFPHQSLLDTYNAVRAIVIVNGSFLAWSQTDD